MLGVGSFQNHQALQNTAAVVLLSSAAVLCVQRKNDPVRAQATLLKCSWCLLASLCVKKKKKSKTDRATLAIISELLKRGHLVFFNLLTMLRWIWSQSWDYWGRVVTTFWIGCRLLRGTMQTYRLT